MDNKAFCEDNVVEMERPNKVYGKNQRPNGSIPSIHSVSTTMADEIRPIIVNRPILRTENLWIDGSKCDLHLSPQSNQIYPHNDRGLLKSIRKYSKVLLPTVAPPINNEVQQSTCLGLLRTFLPILHWLPNYKIKQDFLHDLVTGFTMLALHIPQGMAFGKLAGVDSINGLYVSLFPVIIYTLFGTSKHVSIGTFAVISIACKDVIESFDMGDEVIAFGPNNGVWNRTYSVNSLPTPIEILTSLAFFVGCIQFGLSLLQLGVTGIILSNPLISGFVVAASVHVFTSQMFAFVGLDSNANNELEMPIPFDIINNWIHFFRQLPSTNIPTLLLSIICICILILCKYWLEPFLIKKFKLKNLVLPVGILLIIITTFLSWIFDFNNTYKIEIFPEIPQAFLNLPTVPRFEFMSRLYAPAILISLVTFTTTYSVGKMYSRQHGYEVSANQELMALGAANIFSSFFLCYPCASSVGRSAVQDRVGGRTQLATLISSLLLLIFLRYFSSSLRTLPMVTLGISQCVLSSIILVAIISILQRFREFFDAWRFSKLDGIMWIVTFTFVVLFGIGHGLLYSVLFSFFILIVRLANPVVNLKQHVYDSELFMEISHTGPGSFRENFIKHASPRGWIVFEYQGPLIYINANLFRNKFRQRIARYIIEASDAEDNSQMPGASVLKVQNGTHKEVDFSIGTHQSRWNMNMELPRIHTIIFDCSRMLYIDSRGAEVLLDVISNMKKHRAQVVLASLSEIVYRNLHQLNFFDKYCKSQCFLTVIDAVTNIENHYTYQPLFAANTNEDVMDFNSKNNN